MHTPEFPAQQTEKTTNVACIHERVTGRHFMIQRGDDVELIEQLIEKSGQERIVRFCPDDSVRRFASPESYAKWKLTNGGRTPYFLTDDSGELAGLIWYGVETVTDFQNSETNTNHTFAIRMYDGSEGKKLAAPFMKQTMKDYISHLVDRDNSDDFNGIHLQTDNDNHAAISLYEKIGFYKVNTDENGRITMIILPEQIAQL